LSARAVAARLGLARATVARALQLESPPRYCRARDIVVRAGYDQTDVAGTRSQGPDVMVHR
jgi:hypothetical protein